MAIWFDILNKDNGERAEIYIYGAIVNAKWDPADPEVTPIDFKQELDAVKSAKDIDLYVNSPGGNVFAGMAIYHMLKRLEANVVGHVDGIAASISSVILMAAKKIIAPKTSMMLAHKPLVSGFMYGNAKDLRKISDELDKVEELIVNAYGEKTGIKSEKIREIMEKDTYMTGEEAVNEGFADALDENTQISASVDNEFVVVNQKKFEIRNYVKLPIDKVKNLFVPESFSQKKEVIDYSIIENQLKLINL